MRSMAIALRRTAGTRRRIRRQQRPAAFTLIELMMVVFIIAVLAALLLGALVRARGLGKRAACVNNLNQLLKGNQLYSIDFKHFMPGKPGGDASGTHWRGWRAEEADPWDPAKGVVSSQQIGGGLECPLRETELQGASISGMSYRNYGSYGYNFTGVGSQAYLLGYKTTWDPAPFLSGLKPEQIGMPSRTLSFADSAHLRSGTVLEFDEIAPPFSICGTAPPEKLKTKKPTPSLNSSTIHFRHGGTANAAWTDGHVTQELMEWSSDADRRSKNIGGFGPQDNTLFDPWMDDIPDE